MKINNNLNKCHTCQFLCKFPYSVLNTLLPFKEHRKLMFLLYLMLKYINNYASMLAYVAFCSMNSRRGPTSSPINIENM